MRKILQWIKDNILDRGCIDYTKPYVDPINKKSDEEIKKYFNLPKQVRIHTNSLGQKFADFGNGVTSILPDYQTYRGTVGSCVTRNIGTHIQNFSYPVQNFSYPGESNIGYHNSRL